MAGFAAAQLAVMAADGFAVRVLVKAQDGLLQLVVGLADRERPRADVGEESAVGAVGIEVGAIQEYGPEDQQEE